jgi:hypothetical protein
VNEKIIRFPHPVSLDDVSKYWKQEYRKKRYMRSLSNDELDKRIADITCNLMVLDDDRKYRPQFRIRDDGTYAPIRNLDFLRMSVEAWVELCLRGLHDDGRTIDQKHVHFATRLADESWCKRPAWVERSRLSHDDYERPKMLFKFGDARWNKELYVSGRLRMFPASGYQDSSLGHARHDDELGIEWYDNTGMLWDVKTDDYYCSCFSCTYYYRLYEDFPAEAGQPSSCVAISDPAEFSKRVFNAVERHNAEHPDCKMASLRECPVIYVDPFSLERPKKAEEVYFYKHFRHAYQTEYRYVLQPARTGKLDKFFLELGSLADIAELIVEPTPGK